MKLAIMQPYFFPYIGYFQLIKAVDKFIIYDNIQYTKKGWINRNRILQNGKDSLISIALKSDSDFLNVKERQISADFRRDKLLNQIREAYRQAPYFKQVFPLVEQIIRYNDSNLFQFLHNSIIKSCEYLKIDTEIVISSVLPIDHALKNQEKVLALCQAANANTYLNTIGGSDLYSKEHFKTYGIDLKFIKSDLVAYKQFNNEFVPWLSIIDVMMFNSHEEITQNLFNKYSLV